MLEKIADALAGLATILGVALGGVAVFERDGVLGVACGVCLAVGYGAVRVAEGERRDKGFTVDIE